MFYSKLRNIKSLVLKAYRTNNNLSNEERKSLSKLAKLTEERKIAICRADKEGKIVILNYEDYDAIMTKELQQFEKLGVSAEGCDTYLEKLRKDCNELMVKLHNLGAVNDELLLHVTVIKCKSNSYRKVNGALAKIFLLQYTRLRLSAFQNTSVKPGEFIERGYQRHTCAFATICWEYQHLTNYCFSRINTETY